MEAASVEIAFQINIMSNDICILKVWETKFRFPLNGRITKIWTLKNFIQKPL